MQTGQLTTQSTSTPLGAEAGLGELRWQLWTVDAHLLVTDPAALSDAYRIVVRILADVEAAASRYRADSEVRRLAISGSQGDRVSPMLASLLRDALEAAAETDGDVDPTLGNAMRGLEDGTRPGRTTGLTLTRRLDWRSITLDGQRLWMRPGILLDLGATAKAVAADLGAEAVAGRLGIGVLVGLGGDLRVAGEATPPGGWVIQVQDGPGEPSTSVRLAGATALATSSTLHRAWQRDGRRLHHILDPATCQPAGTLWRTATIGAQTCLRANTLSTACLVRGKRAPALISAAGVAARLVGSDRNIYTFGGFPA